MATYSIVPSLTNATEGNTINFVITKTGGKPNERMHWKLRSIDKLYTIDFEEKVTSGNLTLNGYRQQFNLTVINPDPRQRGVKSFIIQLFNGWYVQNNVVASTPEINIDFDADLPPPTTTTTQLTTTTTTQLTTTTEAPPTTTTTLVQPDVYSYGQTVDGVTVGYKLNSTSAGYTLRFSMANTGTNTHTVIAAYQFNGPIVGGTSPSIFRVLSPGASIEVDATIVNDSYIVPLYLVFGTTVNMKVADLYTGVVYLDTKINTSLMNASCYRIINNDGTVNLGVKFLSFLKSEKSVSILYSQLVNSIISIPRTDTYLVPPGQSEYIIRENGSPHNAVINTAYSIYITLTENIASVVKDLTLVSTYLLDVGYNVRQANEGASVDLTFYNYTNTAITGEINAVVQDTLLAIGGIADFDTNITVPVGYSVHTMEVGSPTAIPSQYKMDLINILVNRTGFNIPLLAETGVKINPFKYSPYAKINFEKVVDFSNALGVKLYLKTTNNSPKWFEEINRKIRLYYSDSPLPTDLTTSSGINIYSTDWVTQPKGTNTEIQLQQVINGVTLEVFGYRSTTYAAVLDFATGEFLGTFIFNANETDIQKQITVSPIQFEDTDTGTAAYVNITNNLPGTKTFLVSWAYNSNTPNSLNQITVLGNGSVTKQYLCDNNTTDITTFKTFYFLQNVLALIIADTTINGFTYSAIDTVKISSNTFGETSGNISFKQDGVELTYNTKSSFPLSKKARVVHAPTPELLNVAYLVQGYYLEDIIPSTENISHDLLDWQSTSDPKAKLKIPLSITGKYYIGLFDIATNKLINNTYLTYDINYPLNDPNYITCSLTGTTTVGGSIPYQNGGTTLYLNASVINNSSDNRNVIVKTFPYKIINGIKVSTSEDNFTSSNSGVNWSGWLFNFVNGVGLAGSDSVIALSKNTTVNTMHNSLTYNGSNLSTTAYNSYGWTTIFNVDGFDLYVFDKLSNRVIAKSSWSAPTSTPTVNSNTYITVNNVKAKTKTGSVESDYAFGNSNLYFSIDIRNHTVPSIDVIVKAFPYAIINGVEVTTDENSFSNNPEYLFALVNGYGFGNNDTITLTGGGTTQTPSVKTFRNYNIVNNNLDYDFQSFITLGYKGFYFNIFTKGTNTLAATGKWELTNSPVVNVSCTASGKVGTTISSNNYAIGDSSLYIIADITTDATSNQLCTIKAFPYTIINNIKVPTNETSFTSNPGYLFAFINQNVTIPASTGGSQSTLKHTMVNDALTPKSAFNFKDFITLGYKGFDISILNATTGTVLATTTWQITNTVTVSCTASGKVGATISSNNYATGDDSLYIIADITTNATSNQICTIKAFPYTILNNIKVPTNETSFTSNPGYLFALVNQNVTIPASTSGSQSTLKHTMVNDALTPKVAYNFKDFITIGYKGFDISILNSIGTVVATTTWEAPAFVNSITSSFTTTITAGGTTNYVDYYISNKLYFNFSLANSRSVAQDLIIKLFPYVVTNGVKTSTNEAYFTSNDANSVNYSGNLYLFVNGSLSGTDTITVPANGSTVYTMKNTISNTAYDYANLVKPVTAIGGFGYKGFDIKIINKNTGTVLNTLTWEAPVPVNPITASITKTTTAGGSTNYVNYIDSSKLYFNFALTNNRSGPVSLIIKAFPYYVTNGVKTTTNEAYFTSNDSNSVNFSGNLFTFINGSLSGTDTITVPANSTTNYTMKNTISNTAYDYITWVKPSTMIGGLGASGFDFQIIEKTGQTVLTTLTWQAPLPVNTVTASVTGTTTAGGSTPYTSSTNALYFNVSLTNNRSSAANYIIRAFPYVVTNGVKTSTNEAYFTSSDSNSANFSGYLFTFINGSLSGNDSITVPANGSIVYTMKNTILNTVNNYYGWIKLLLYTGFDFQVLDKTTNTVLSTFTWTKP